MPQQLTEGEIGFASDTGEIFIGGPRVTSAPYITPPPRNRHDKNIRILTELDSVAKPNSFTNVVLPAHASQVPVFHFLNGDNFAIVDYGVSNTTTGALSASTMYIALGPSNVLNDPFPPSAVTFAISIGSDLNPQLTVSNNTGNQIAVTYTKRTWQSISSSSTTLFGSLRKITGHIGLVNTSVQIFTISGNLKLLTGLIQSHQSITQAGNLAGSLSKLTGSMFISNTQPAPVPMVIQDAVITVPPV